MATIIPCFSSVRTHAKS